MKSAFLAVSRLQNDCTRALTDGLRARKDTPSQSSPAIQARKPEAEGPDAILVPRRLGDVSSIRHIIVFTTAHCGIPPSPCCRNSLARRTGIS